MANEPLWLTTADVGEIHDDQLRRFGGAPGLKSLPLLESAVAAPRHLLHYGLEQHILRLGTQLAYAIVRNHPFVDGNKRTATVTMLEFLFLNGLTIDLPDTSSEQPLAEMIEGLAARTIDAVDLAVLLSPHVIAADA